MKIKYQINTIISQAVVNRNASIIYVETLIIEIHLKLVLSHFKSFRLISLHICLILIEKPLNPSPVNFLNVA